MILIRKKETESLRESVCVCYRKGERECVYVTERV
jgi:hypothetical protein